MDIRDTEEISNGLKEQISTLKNIQNNMYDGHFYPEILSGDLKRFDWFNDFQSQCNTLLECYFEKDSNEYKSFNESLSSMVNDIKCNKSNSIANKEDITDYIFKRFDYWLTNTIRDLDSFLIKIEKTKHTKNQKETEPYIQFNAYGGNAISSSTANASSIVNITIEQTINAIKEMPEATLSQEEKEKLQNDLYTLEGIKTTKDKKKFWEKAKPVLSFLTDKGADALIAAAPYIITVLKNM